MKGIAWKKGGWEDSEEREGWRERLTGAIRTKGKGRQPLSLSWALAAPFQSTIHPLPIFPSPSASGSFINPFQNLLMHRDLWVS